MSSFFSKLKGGLRRPRFGAATRPAAPGKKDKDAATPPPPETTHTTHPHPKKQPAETAPTRTGAPGGAATKAKKRAIIVNDPRTFEPRDDDDVSPRPPAATATSKTPEETAILTAALQGHYVFAHLAANDLAQVVARMARTVATAGTVIIEQGAPGDCFFVLECGRAEIVVDGAVVGAYDKPGASFGELALLYSARRAATIRSTERCVLWSLDMRTFHRLAIRRHKAGARGRVEFLRKVKLLAHVGDTQLAKIADALTEVAYAKGARIITEGETGDDFFLVRRGAVECTRRKPTAETPGGTTTSGGGDEADEASSQQQQMLMRLGAGDYFGEMALVLDEPRHADVTALEATSVYKISRHDFARLFGPLRDLLQHQMRLRILKSVGLLRDLADDVLAQLAGRMRVQVFAPGARVVTEGEAGSRFYIINEGSARVTKKGTADATFGAGGPAETVLGTLKEQDFFGERALITNEPRAASVVAVTQLECLVLDGDAFRAHLADVDAVKKERHRKRTSAGTHGDAARPRAEDLQRLRTLGTGTFGRVALVVHQTPQQRRGGGAPPTVYALKQMQKAQIVASHQQRNIMNEKNLLLLCSHPCVLGLVATYQDRDCLYMLMDLVQGGELWSLVYEKVRETAHLRARGFGCFDEAAATFYAGCVVAAFEHIHGYGIAYRDLKPENLLVDARGYVKVIDFGFAKQVPWTDDRGAVHDKTYTICGTPEYLCPELLQSRGHDRAVDYWALGCLVYELLVGKTPFADDRQPETFRKILNARKLLHDTSALWPPRFPPAAKQLVQGLCKHEPAYRLGMQRGGVRGDIAAHPFFAGVDFDGLVAGRLDAPYVPHIKDPLDVSNFDPYDEVCPVKPFKGNQALFADWADMGADFPPAKLGP